MAETSLEGSCLCGTVKYRATGTVLKFLHCHCSRCRKATGTGHATNLLLKGSVEWLGGADAVNRFKVPDAARFTAWFCSNCGSPLPRAGAEISVIPAGSVDGAIDRLPEGRIFWDSRADWSCESGSLPAHSEYPPS